jgi:NAD-dependent deacetylase
MEKQAVLKSVTKLARMIIDSKYAIVLTGAGISTESGIPDFRSPGGLWDKFSPDIYGNIHSFLENPFKFWEMAEKIAPNIFKAKPNPAHYALAELEKKNLIKAIITQNVDGLHQKAGSVLVYEIHGNIDRFVCFGCRASYPREQVIRKLKKEKHYPPICDMCKAPLKPSAVLFGEDLPKFEYYQSHALAEKSDLMIVAGSSLEVAPVCDLPNLTLKYGGKLAIVNDVPTYMDEKAELNIIGRLGTILPLVVSKINDLLKNMNEQNQ